MFKKERDLAERSRSLLKNKETRKLKTDILAKLPLLKEDELDAIVGKESFTRIYLATKTIVYAIGDVPYFIDVEGRNNIVPTVQLLWKCPTALRCYVIHAPVSEYVMKGADLMLPGLATVDGLEGVMRGEKMSIRVVGNPLPFAVGESNVSWDAILVNGRKGKALEVMSVYGDCLVPLKGAAPNSGFGASSIYGLDGYVERGDQDEDEENDEAVGEGGAMSYKGALKAATRSAEDGGKGEMRHLGESLDRSHVTPDAQDMGKEGDEEGVGGGSDEELEEEREGGNAGEEGEEEEEEEGEEEKAKQIGPDAMDALMLMCTLRAIKYVVKDKQLPMLVSTFWSIIQRCGLPDDVAEVDVRRSSYKKVSTFLKAVQGMELLTMTETNGVASVVGTQRAHDLFRGCKVDDPEALRGAVEGGSAGGGGGGGGGSGSGGGGGSCMLSGVGAGGAGMGLGLGAGKATVVELYRLPKNLKDVFGVVKGQFGEHLRASEVRDVLVMYFKSQGLEMGSDGHVAGGDSVGTGSSTSGSSSSGSGGGGNSGGVKADRSSVRVPPTDALYSIAAGVVAKQPAVKPAISVPVPVPVPAVSPPAGGGAGTSGAGDHDDQYGDGDGYGDNDDHEERMGGLGSRGGNTVGGVWMPPVAGGGPWGTAQQHKSSSSSSSTSSASSSSSSLSATEAGSGAGLGAGTGMGFRSSTGSGPALLSVVAGSMGDGRGSGMKGSSAVGGWGVDKGTVWKPTMLPTAPPPVPAVSAKKAKKAKGGGSGSGSGGGGGGAGGAETERLPVVVRKDELMKALLKKLSPYFAIVSPTGQYQISSGQLPTVQVMVETRMGNKVVTHIRGLEVFGVDLGVFVKDCQRRFACAASVGLVPGMVKDREVVVQGHLSAELEGLLVDQCGVPRHLIEVKVAKGVKPKKR